MKKSNLKNAAFTALIIISLTSIISCSKKSYAEPQFSTNKQSKLASTKAISENVYSDMSNLITNNMVMEESLERSSDISESSINYERKLIKTGNIDIEVQSLADVENSIYEFSKKYNGYITDSFMYESGFNITVRIPASVFDEAINNAGELGKIKNRSINARDVSDDFYDLQSRLETKKTLQKKLESYLSSAKDLKELLEVEKQLNSVISEIESMEGRMKRLSSQIDYSTIYFSMRLPTGYNDSGFDWPDLGENFKEFGYNIIVFAANLLMFIFYIVIFGIPVIAVGAFFFWLLFGRVGLLIKLYKKLKWRK